MTTVIGIDFGAADTVVAFVGRGSVDIVRNEVSERKTPSLVGFTPSARLLGEGALATIKSNSSNTCRFPKNLIGRKATDPAVADEAFWQLCPLTAASSGEVGYSVSYQNQPKTFSATEVSAMLMSRLIETTANFTQCKAKDCVISVPPFFDEQQRQAVLDAACIANLNCLRVINDHTATALGYGIYRTADFHEENATSVAFCSMGHTYFSCSIVSFLKNQLTILSECSDASVSGRGIEHRMMEKCRDVFLKNTKLDAFSSPKAKFKIEEACAKAKKVLSANLEAGVNIECLMEEKDLNVVFQRGDIEQMCLDMADKIKACIAKAVADSGVSEFANIEIVGGCSRIPFVQKVISESFSKDLSRTLNADECVARGCALQAAILSPLFKVREFVVKDVSNSAVSVSWRTEATETSHSETVDGDADMAEEHQNHGGIKRVVVFPSRSKLGTTKVMSFFRSANLELTAETDKGLLGKYKVDLSEISVRPVKVKVRATLTGHGTFAVEGAYAAIDEEYEEKIQEEVPASEKPEGEEPKQYREVVVKKTRTKKAPLAVTCSDTNGLPSNIIADLEKAEVEMIKSDNEIMLRDVARNDLEAYIFSCRNKIAEIEGQVDAENKLNAAEDWVYENYEEGIAAFVDKLAELKAAFSFLGAKEQEVEQPQDAEMTA